MAPCTLGANANVASIRNWTNTLFIFDSDGDLHADAAVSASAYDVWDDSHLARALMVEIGGKNIVRSEFDNWLKYNRQHLVDLGIVTFNEGPGEDGSVFVNWTQMTRVLAGAAWQTATCIMRIERDYNERIAALEARVNTLLGGQNPRMLGA